MAWERIEIETGLRRALDLQQLALHYQPQVDLKTGHIIGMEALLRWESRNLAGQPHALYSSGRGNRVDPSHRRVGITHGVSGVFVLGGSRRGPSCVLLSTCHVNKSHIRILYRLSIK